MAKFRIDIARQGQPRLIATEQLTPSDFSAITRDLHVRAKVAHKVGFVSARIAARPETIETLWNGTESTIAAKPGDRIVTNMTPSREILRDAGGNANSYVISPEKFAELYERDSGSTEYGDVYRARGIVNAIFFPAGFEIVAPWGEVQRANAGYLLKNGNDVYGNNKETFDATYVLQG